MGTLAALDTSGETTPSSVNITESISRSIVISGDGGPGLGQPAIPDDDGSRWPAPHKSIGRRFSCKIFPSFTGAPIIQPSFVSSASQRWIGGNTGKRIAGDNRQVRPYLIEDRKRQCRLHILVNMQRRMQRARSGTVQSGDHDAADAGLRPSPRL